MRLFDAYNDDGSSAEVSRIGQMPGRLVGHTKREG
jgi:hypothetical protein